MQIARIIEIASDFRFCNPDKAAKIDVAIPFVWKSDQYYHFRFLFQKNPLLNFSQT